MSSPFRHCEARSNLCLVPYHVAHNVERKTESGDLCRDCFVTSVPRNDGGDWLVASSWGFGARGSTLCAMRYATL
jgi:hypothetical protein